MSEIEIDAESRALALGILLRALMLVLAEHGVVPLSALTEVVELATSIGTTEHPQNAGVNLVIGKLGDFVAMNRDLEAQHQRPWRKDPKGSN